MKYLKQLFVIVSLSAFLAACGGGGGGGGGGDEAAPSGQTGGSGSPQTTPPPASGGNTGNPPSEPGNNSGETSNYSVKLSWSPPSTREDGSPLSLSELTGYEIYYYLDGTDASQGQVKQVSGGTTTSAEIALPGPGTYYFAIAARDQNGLISNLSNYVSATFN